MTRFRTHFALLLAVGGVIASSGCELIVGGHNVPAGGEGPTTTSSGKGGTGTGGKTATGGTGGTTSTGGTGGTSTGGTGGTGTGGTNTGGTGTGGTGPTCTTMACTDASQCPDPGSVCVTATCDMGCCGTSNVADLTPAGQQTAGDCQMVVCDGLGGTKSVDDNNDPLDDGNECTDDVCVNGAPFNDAAALMGASCTSNGGVLCDGNGACVECLADTDCAMGSVCDPQGGTHTCIPGTCTDGVQAGDETDVDCGGSCGATCVTNQMCMGDGDCVNGICTGGTCAAPTCSDTVQNAAETDVDCGGGTCPKCGPTLGCKVDADCIGGSCSGTVCLATCTDGVKNSSESDVDCGGASCAKCGAGKTCGGATDCASGVCTGGVCQAPTCGDGVKNGGETGTDCGGGTCPTCAAGQGCASGADCATGVCSGGLCQAPACNDSVKNGSESDVDCGGSCATKCGVGKTCNGAADCASNVCTGGVCAAPNCGDGIKSAGEGCDDGNTASGDGCSSSCLVEFGYTCSGTPSACTATCGDGFKAASEGCDDHNATAGDGCSPTCTVEPGFNCTGVAPSVCTTVCGDGQKGGAEGCDDGNTTAGDGCSPTCAPEPGFTCVGQGPGSCTSTCGDGVKASNEGCDDGNIANNDGCSATCAPETGYTCTGQGPGSCTTTCGDGIKAGAEACDDGNALSTDGCSSTCAVEFGYNCAGQGPGSCTTTCGDGMKAASEACDDGNGNNSDGCSSTCTIEPGFNCTGNQPSVCSAGCGDGVVAGSEACDDGNNLDGDGCSSICAPEMGWNCVGQGPGSCMPICGDGISVGLEACDDGNLTPGDGCDATCGQEAGWMCVGAGPGSCMPVCGDAVLLGIETCDDGNTANGDGCSAMCAQESGWSCTGTGPGSCIATCGDNIKVGPEQCDDGNTANGDGCSSTCLIEPGFEIESNNTIATANDFAALAVGNKINGYFKPGGDKDYFAVTIPPGSLGTIDASFVDNFAGTPCAGTALDTFLSLLTAGGARIAEDDDIAGSSNRCSRVLAGGLVPGTYYLEARAFSSTGQFPYSLTVNVTLTTCGNGTVEPGEACDDGNTANGDGCSDVCKVEPKSDVEPNSTCATANGAYPLSLTGLLLDGVVSAGSSTTGSTADLDWYTFTLPAYGDVQFETFDSTGPGNCNALIATSLQLFQSNCTTQIGTTKTTGGINSCAKINPTADTYARHLAPGTYAVRVNTNSAAAATFGYMLKANLVALCGNGVQEGSEECDGGAGCAADCTFIPVCGNGVKQTGEQCDDGNTANGDGCSSTCQWEQTPETESNNTCATANGPFVIPAPGSFGLLFSGSLNPPGTTSGDQDWYRFTLTGYADVKFETFDSTGPNSCASPVDTRIALFQSNCTTQVGTTQDQGAVGNCSKLDPTTQPTAMKHLAPGDYVLRVDGFGSTAYGYMLKANLVALCGNGVQEGSEECDGGAGCAADCTLLPVCGNGSKQAGEQCDDGNTANGDGCSSTCQIEATSEVEPNDTIAQADTALPLITASTNILGAITPTGDVDTFKLSIATERVVRFEVFDATGATIGADCTTITAAMNLKLLDAAGTLLKQDIPSSDTAASGITANCPALIVNLVPGTYYIQAAKTATGTIAAYLLQIKYETDNGSELEPNETIATATAEAGNDFFVFGNHQVGTDVDVYAVTIPPGPARSIRAEVVEGDASKTCESKGIDSFLTLYNAAGTNLASDDDDGRGYCSAIDGTGGTARDSGARNLAPGSYYLEVKRSSSFTAPADIFNYKLAITIRQ
jgi:cysteine-rich repeat protein